MVITLSYRLQIRHFTWHFNCIGESCVRTFKIISNTTETFSLGNETPQVFLDLASTWNFLLHQQGYIFFKTINKVIYIKFIMLAVFLSISFLWSKPLCPTAVQDRVIYNINKFNWWLSYVSSAIYIYNVYSYKKTTSM